MNPWVVDAAKARRQMSRTQSPEVALASGGTDLISAVLDTGNGFCQSHLDCNYDMIIMCFTIDVRKIQGLLVAQTSRGWSEERGVQAGQISDAEIREMKAAKGQNAPDAVTLL